MNKNPRFGELEMLYTFIKPKKEHIVLDALAGDGFASKPLIGKVASIVALDSRLPEQLPRNTSYVNGNAEDTKLENNYFDIILAHTGFHHVGNGNSKLQEKALQEFYRILKPSGTLVISDLQGKSPSAKFNDDYVEGHANKCNWITTPEIKQLLEKTQFRDVIATETNIFWKFPTYKDLEAFTAKKFRIPENDILAKLQQYNLTASEPAVKLQFWYARGVK